MTSIGSAIIFVLLVITTLGCGSTPRPFPNREPLWRDLDRRTYSQKPEEYFSPFAWDGADQMVFRPVSRFFAVDPGGEAINVNALDEVPDSSWFTNRIGRFPMSPEEVQQGYCVEPVLEPVGKWTIKDAKPNGANPGFIIKADDGRKYLLKFDGTLQGERATSADVFGSRIYHAVGFHAPCNTVVFFTPDVLVLDEGATRKSRTGREVPLTWEDIETVLSKSYRLPDGRYRASASLFLPGLPIGPWRYEGTRSDDPNDRVAHEDRRELRGGYVLSSWLNHFDSREQNTLAIWIETENKTGYVRHYYIDFGDCFGSLWDQEGISRRLGHAYYLDIPYLVEDALTLGVLDRPWHSPQFGPTGPVLGYWSVKRFVPDQWRPGYPNPAFGRATERDKAWMARIIAQLTDQHIAAALEPARIHDALTEREIIRILKGRKQKLLRRWFKDLSPLTHPRLYTDGNRTNLCLRDLAVFASVVSPKGRSYQTRAWRGIQLDSIPVAPVRTGNDERVCLQLPNATEASTDEPQYLIVDISAHTKGYDSGTLARVHLYQSRVGAYRIVGLERPDNSDPPQL